MIDSAEKLPGGKPKNREYSQDFLTQDDLSKYFKRDEHQFQRFCGRGNMSLIPFTKRGYVICVANFEV